MEVIHETPFVADLEEVIDKDGSTARVAVLKATFEVAYDGTLHVAEEQEPICIADEWFTAPGTSSMIYESDGAYFKAATDIIVTGKAYAPLSRPAESFFSEFSVGPITKRILVIGDRHWSYSAIFGARMSAPEPFIEMPLCWERAFGGEDKFHRKLKKHGMERRNPIGTGFRVTRSSDALDGLALPNFEHPRMRVRSWRSKPPPQGFGFIGRNWLPRVQYAGTYDETWQRNRMPILPVDFDDRFFNAAPPDQIYPGYLQGGEVVRAMNLSEKGGERFVLPRVDVKLRGVARKKPFTIQGLLDTAVFQLDKRRIILTWRGKYTVSLNEPAADIRADVVSLDHLPIK
jgi:hypothetical protein